MPNRSSPPAVLVRESYRQGGKVRKRTLANLSKLPDRVVDGLRILLKGGIALNSIDDGFEVLRSRPHGHVAAVLGAARKLGVEKMLHHRRSREKDIAMAMIAARVLDPRSQLADARALRSETLVHTLGEELGVADAEEDEVRAAVDWLGKRRKWIERKLARKHLEEGSQAFCVPCLGVPRGQVAFALLCDAEGRPVAVETFEGDAADPGAAAALAEKLAKRFKLSKVAPVSAAEAASARESLRRVKRSLRFVKSADLRLPDVARARVFLCMMACYVEWHMRRALAPVLRQDQDPEAAEDRLPTHSFESLLADLATLTRNSVRPNAPGAAATDVLARPTPLQEKAFKLLGVRP